MTSYLITVTPTGGQPRSHQGIFPDSIAASFHGQEMLADANGLLLPGRVEVLDLDHVDMATHRARSTGAAEAAAVWRLHERELAAGVHR